MATFVGTENEFTHFVMPYVRNYVQYLTRPVKKSLGNICQHCGKKVKSLDAAHKHGHERPIIVHQLLQRYKTNRGYEVDLISFEEELKRAHTPISEHILFLCKECHMEYDAAESCIQPKIPPAGNTIARYTSTPKKKSSTLPIETIPSEKKEFAKQFTKTGYAVIRTIYHDGRQKEQGWYQRDFNAGSNVIGNLRSRPQFRQGKWQALGIKEVLVYIPAAIM